MKPTLLSLLILLLLGSCGQQGASSTDNEAAQQTDCPAADAPDYLVSVREEPYHQSVCVDGELTSNCVFFGKYIYYLHEDLDVPGERYLYVHNADEGHTDSILVNVSENIETLIVEVDEHTNEACTVDILSYGGSGKFYSMTRVDLAAMQQVSATQAVVNP